MSDWRERLRDQLEPILRKKDPRPDISAYHDMPYAIFRYPPTDEFAVREELSLLITRLEQAGKRITVISLADCLAEAHAAEGISPEALADAERNTGIDAARGESIDSVNPWEGSLQISCPGEIRGQISGLNHQCEIGMRAPTRADGSP